MADLPRGVTHDRVEDAGLLILRFLHFDLTLESPRELFKTLPSPNPGDLSLTDLEWGLNMVLLQPHPHLPMIVMYS